ncbi:MAG: hypothetical protein IKP00_13435 [Victivallales bacterium]|nr:hypothetical protein [Victivallales bacterium]
MKIPNHIQAFLCRLNPVSIFNRIRTFARGFNPVPYLVRLWQGMAARLRQCRLGLARLVPHRFPRAVTLSILSVVVVLAGVGSCHSRLAHPKPRFTMAMLDSRAAAHIGKAKAAIPDVVADICHERGHLYWLMVKDKCLGGDRARQYIAQKLDKRIVVPLRQAAAVYKCAVNADAAVGMTEEVALDALSSQLYATAGLAIEGFFIRATLESCLAVAGRCAPQLAATLGASATCAAADGPLPIGDIVGAALAVGGTVWCCRDIYKAHKALPANLAAALETAVAATVAQCRQEAASAL